MPKTLPVLLKNPEILLLGAGAVALHKARVLRDNNIDFKVISAQVSPDFAASGIEVMRKKVDSEDLHGYTIIVDATGDDEVGRILHATKSERNILLNRVDNPAECDFYFSSLLNYGSLKIAVSTDGSSPALGQAVRDRIRQTLPTLTAVPEFLIRKSRERSQGINDFAATRREIKTMLGQVYMLGCDPGEPDLFTVKACRYLHQADMVLYDDLISAPILELIPPDTPRCYVGKTDENQACTQEEINAQLVAYARDGLRIARLKSELPCVFGGETEELMHLAQHGISVEVVPGISSVLGAPVPSTAVLEDIPLISRGLCAGYSVVSALLDGNRFNSAWIPLLHRKDHITVVLMGLNVAHRISASARHGGVGDDMPVVIVANAATDDQQCVITDIAGLPDSCKTVESPAIMIFGAVER